MKKILSTTILIVAVTLLNAQTDSMYFMKNGGVINRQAVKPVDLDSIIFYDPHQPAPSESPTSHDTMFMMKEGFVINKQALKSTDLDSIVFNDTSSAFTNVAVVFPENSELNPSDYKLFSSAEFTDVSESGESKVLHYNGGRSIAFLMDSQNEPILMGFITDNKKEVSVASTIEVAQYFALGTIFLPEEIRSMYVEQAGQLPGTKEFIATVETMFSSDINFLASEVFAQELQKRTDELTARKQVDLQNKSILISTGDFKSGMQIEEVDFQNVAIANTYRRRAHGFLYKTAFEDKDGNKTVLVSDVVEKEPAAKFDVAVPPTQAIRDFKGIMQDAAAGTGIKFFRNSSDPIKLELGEDQSKCIYQLRVIGPSAFAGKLTDVEEEKLRTLEIETLALDLALPILMDVIGSAELIDKIDDKKFKAFVSTVELFAKSFPAVLEPMKKGDYSKALHELLFTMGNNYNSDLVKDIFNELIEDVWAYTVETGSDVKPAVAVEKNISFLLKTIKVADYILKFFDYKRIFSAMANSNMVEQWEVVIKDTKVSLVPHEAIVFPYIKKYIDAFVKDTELGSEQIFQYKWSTTGEYGVLQDDVGHEGTSFSNSSRESKREIFYLSKARDSEVPDNATDKVFVEAFIKDVGKEPVLVGKDTTTLRIRPYKYQIYPKNIKISGGTDLSLYIQRADGSEDITNNPSKDYKIVWSTNGEYGLLEGNATSVTKINDVHAVYSATDREVKTATEVVQARIYVKSKDEGPEAYELYYELEATIQIENDENKITFYRPFNVRTEVFDPSQCTGATITAALISFAPVEDAESYSVTIFKKDGSAPVGPVEWQAGQPVPSGYRFITPSGLYEGQLHIQVAAGTYCANADYQAKVEADLANLKGSGQIVVTLKNK